MYACVHMYIYVGVAAGCAWLLLVVLLVVLGCSKLLLVVLGSS